MPARDNKLDPELQFFARRNPRVGALTPQQALALNVLWRQRVRIPVLEKVFGIGRQSIYGRVLTGEGDSYPTTARTSSAREANALIDSIGLEEAERRYVTPAIAAAVKKHTLEHIAHKHYASELVKRRRSEVR